MATEAVNVRHAVASLVITLLLVAVGCAPVEPESDLEWAAREVFGSSLMSVKSALAESPAPHWRADVVLDSELPMRDIDTAAAGLMVQLSDETSASTPIVVSVVGPGLAPEGARAQWGQLFYDWGLNSGESSGERGTTVSLYRSEADEPVDGDGIVPSSAYEVKDRGVWREVDVSTLSMWSQLGTPAPEPSSP